MNDIKDKTKDYYRLLKNTIDSLDLDQIEDTISVLHDALMHKKTIYVFGNGGSSATASHMAVDFNKGISDVAPEKFRLICLNDNIPTLMAVANDISFDNVFYHQLLGRLRKEDLIIAISGSGNSKNVIKAVEYARELGTKIIGISGYDGGKLYKLSDYHLHAPISHMQVVEDVHMSFDHMIMTIFYEYFSSKTNN